MADGNNIVELPFRGVAPTAGLRAAPVMIRPMRFAPPPPKGQRYELRTWADGYAIYDRGDLIVTVHGQQFDLAAKIHRDLCSDDARGPQPPEAA